MHPHKQSKLLSLTQYIPKGLFAMKYSRIIIASFVATMMLIMAGCGNQSDITDDKSGNTIQDLEKDLHPEYGGTLTLASFVPDTLNPLATKYQPVRDVLMIIYDGLFKSQSDLKAVPVLAQSYTVSTSNKIYTIKLKQNVVFHDGSAFDAEDVVATFKYIKEYPTPYSEMFENVLNFKAIDKHTVSIELISPQLDFVNNLDFAILPAGLSKEAFESENPYFVPYGTGKYKYESQLRNKYMTLVRADNIHDGKDVYIDSIKVKFLHSTQDMFHAFDAGETDMFITNGSNWGEFTFTSDVKTYETGSPRYTYMGINVKNEHLQDAALRRNINKILDKKAMVEEVMFSHAIPAELPVISTAYYLNKDADKNENKTEGSTINENDVFDSKDIKAPEYDKYNISLYLLYNKESQEKSRAAQYIKKSLAPYGITIQMQSVDFDEYKKRIAEENYDLYIGETILHNNMNMNFMFNSAQKTEQKICNYADTQFDSLLGNIDMMTPGTENADIIYRNFTEYFAQNMPQIPLFHTNTALFVSNRIKGSINPGMSFFYSDIAEFFIKYY